MKAALVVLFLIGLIAASSCHQATSSSISVDDFRQVEREDARAGKYMAFYELAQELAEKVESKRSTEQSECRVLTGLQFCNMIDYPTAGDPAFDALLFQSANDSFNEDTDCNLSYKALICTMFYRGCEVTADGFRNLPTCRSQCIDFTTKCAAFYTGGFCTDPRVYAPDDSTVTRCSKALAPPSPTCSVPAFDTGACAAYVTYTTPTGPNPVINAQLGELTSAYFAYLNATIDVALSEQTTTPEQANICFLTYQRMLCRYIFLECTGDPFQININCELNCQDLYFSCPFMRPDGYEPPADGEIDDSCGLVLPGCKPLPVGFTYGDPHFNTLDGAPFEFNGLGEFIIAETTDSDAVQVQARFEKCNSNGDATCTTAAGLQGYGHSVRLYSSSSSVTVRVDSETLNIDSTQWPYSVANGDIVILRESGTQNFEVQTKNGLSFQYRLQEGFTMIAVGAGSGLRNKLKGFYGNFDGLRANDFETRAGTIVNFPPTASETFTWGQTWRVSESESVFDYDSKTYADINDASFVPSFSDSGMTFSGAATTACADLSEQFYRSCLFDVTVTGDVNFARASALAQERIAELTPVDNTPIDGYEPTAEEPSGATTVQVAAAVIACSLLTMMY